MTVILISKFGKRPMHFFGPLGMLTFFIGFIILVILSYEKIISDVRNIQERPLFFLGFLTVIIGCQLFLTGFLAELVVRNSSHRNQYDIGEIIGLDKDQTKLIHPRTLLGHETIFH